MSTRASEYLERVVSLWRPRRNQGQKPASGEPGPAQPKPHASAPAAIGHGDAAQRSAVFSAKLEEFAAKFDVSACLITGRVTLLNTAAIKDRVGDRWDRLSDRIHCIIEAELKARLGDNDIFTRFDAENYVIVFGDCSGAEARLRTSILSDVILDRIFGESEAKDLEGLTFQTFVAKADGSIALEGLSSAETLMGLLDDAATEDDSATGAPQGKTAVEASLKLDDISQLLGELDDQLTAIEEARRGKGAGSVGPEQIQELLRRLEALEKALAAIAPRPSPNDDAGAAGRDSGGLGPAFELLDRLKIRLELEAAGAPGHVKGPVAARPFRHGRREPQIDFSYLPIWHAPTQRVGIYYCNATIRAGKAGLRRSRAASAPGPELLAVADQQALRRAWNDLELAQSDGSSSVVVVPVHFSTLQQIVTQDRLVDLCRHIPPHLRNRLIWEIVGADVENWALQLSELVRIITPFGKAVFLRLEKPQADLEKIAQDLHRLASTDIRSVGVHVAELSGSETEKLGLLDALIDLADRHGLKCYGLGLDSLSLTMCAVCMGYQHVSGSAVGEPVSKPGGIQSTALVNIYSRILSGQRQTPEPAPPPKAAETAS